MANLSDKNKNLTFVPAPQSPDTAGFIKESSDDTVPTGWLECNGQAVSRTTYSELFALIGTTYGVGDGSTTFNLPGGSLLNNAKVATKLEITGPNGATGGTANSAGDDLVIDNNDLCGITLLGGSSSFSSIYLGKSGSETDYRVQRDNTADKIHIVTAGVNRMTFDSGGNTGINKSSPGNTLDVDGTTRTGALIVNGDATMDATAPTLNIAADGDNPATARMTEGSSTSFLGGFIKYDGANNDLVIGTHNVQDSNTGNDLNVLTFPRDGSGMELDGTFTYTGGNNFTSTLGSLVTVATTTANTLYFQNHNGSGVGNGTPLTFLLALTEGKWAIHYNVHFFTGTGHLTHKLISDTVNTFTSPSVVQSNYDQVPSSTRFQGTGMTVVEITAGNTFYYTVAAQINAAAQINLEAHNTNITGAGNNCTTQMWAYRIG